MQLNKRKQGERVGKLTSKTLGHLLIFLLSIIYILNPSAGIFEFLPDNIPFIVNLDEGVATLLLLRSLKYFGFDLTKLEKLKKSSNK